MALMLYQVPKSHHDPINRVGLLPVSTPNWTINVSDIGTFKVSNVSSSTTKKDISDFFSFSGDIQFIEFQRDTETTKLAYVTFKEAQGADTAMLMLGATVVDRPVSITPAENYQLPPYVPLLTIMMKEVNSLKQIRGPDPNYNDICFSGAESDISELSKFFPTVDMVFENGQKLSLFPENYLFRHSKMHGGYCLGIFQNGKDPSSKFSEGYMTNWRFSVVFSYVLKHKGDTCNQFLRKLVKLLKVRLLLLLGLKLLGKSSLN